MTPPPGPLPCWLCSPPQHPSTPFAEPVLVLYDTLRVFWLAATVAVLLLTVVAVRRATTLGQRVRFVSATAVALVAATVAIEHLGDYANGRTVIGVVAIMGMAWGYYSALRYESPSQDGRR